MQELHKEATPANGGWMFRQPQTGFKIDRPESVSWTFDRAVEEIIKHRFKNPAAVAKHGLSTNPDVVEDELMKFNRLRLGIPDPVAQPMSFFNRNSLPERVAVAAGNIKRAAQGTAVVLDWLTSGGAPVEQELANRRAATCIGCVKNVPGDWYTTAPAELIKASLEAREDLNLVTPSDATLKSCDVCRCLNRLKVWCPIAHIVAKTKPEIMAEFLPNCWIKTESAK